MGKATRAKKKSVRRRYLFSLGDTNRGAIGFGAAVVAHSEAEAVRLLRKALPESYEISGVIGAVVTVFFNGRAVSAKDIEDTQPADGTLG